MSTRLLPAALLSLGVLGCASGGTTAPSAPAPTGAPRPWQATDYYRLVALADPAMAPSGAMVAVTVTSVVEARDRRHSEIWLVDAFDAAPNPRRLTKPSIEAAAPIWSPDGRYIAFTGPREGGSRAWFIRPTGGKAFQIRGVMGTPIWSPDGRTILFAWSGAEPDSLKDRPWRERVSPAAITRGPDPRRFDGRVYTSLPFKGDERGYLAPRETRRPNHLYVVPVEGGPPRQITFGALSQTDAKWSPDGSQVAFVEDSTEVMEISPGSREELRVLTVADLSVRRIATGYVSNTDPAWSPDGKTLAFLCSQGRGKETDVCVVPAAGPAGAGGAVRNLTESWDLAPGAPRWSPDGATIYVSAETQGNAHLFAVPAAGGAVRPVTTGERTLRGFTLSADGRTLAYTGSDVSHPFELYVANVESGAAVGEHRVTEFNEGLRAAIAFMPADTFWFTGVGGMRIEGWLMKPHGYQPGRQYPLVLSIHGGPHSNYGNILFPEFQMLAGQGYWMLFTNPRGSSGYGHDFMFATRGRWGMEDYQDLMQAVDEVIARGGVDTTRMAVLGGSYGGFMTNWVVGHTNRFAVAQTDRSIYNWYSWYGSSDAQSLTEYEFLGAPWENDSLYRNLSPMRFADRIRTPLLIVHSEDDFRTPITDAEQLFVMLRKRGVPSEFVRYPRSFHGLSRTGPPWLLVDRLERIRTWFAHWIGTGVERPAAASSSRESSP